MFDLTAQVYVRGTRVTNDFALREKFFLFFSGWFLANLNYNWEQMSVMCTERLTPWTLCDGQVRAYEEVKREKKGE